MCVVFISYKERERERERTCCRPFPDPSVTRQVCLVSPPPTRAERSQALRKLGEEKALQRKEQRRLITDVIEHAAGDKASAVEVSRAVSPSPCDFCCPPAWIENMWQRLLVRKS